MRENTLFFKKITIFLQIIWSIQIKAVPLRQQTYPASRRTARLG